MPQFSIRSLGVLSLLATTLSVGSSVFAQTATPAPTSTPVPAIPGSTLVPASGFFDFVPDTTRGLVYFSSGGQILRWRMSDQTWLAPIAVGDNLRAIDISPDGNTLAVAQARLTTSNSFPGAFVACVALVNLDTLTVTNILYPTLAGENGTYSLAYDSSGNLLISPSIYAGQNGASAFRLWNAATNQVTALYAPAAAGGLNQSPVATNTAIVADTTRNCLSFAEIGSASGNWGFYTPGSAGATGTLMRFMGAAGTSGGNYPNEYLYGVAPDTGSRFFLPTAGALQVRNSSGNFLTPYGGAGTAVSSNNSAAYDSVRSLLYLTPATTSKIEIREPSAFGLRATLDAGMTWPSSPNGTPPYKAAHMRTATNGTLLGLQVFNGVRLYTLQNGLPAGPPVVTSSLTTPEDTPYPFTLGTDPSATYSIVRPPDHGFLTGTGPNYTYVPTANYNGPDFFAIAINGSGRGVNVTVTPVNDAPVAVGGTVSNHTNETRAITLFARDVDLPQGVNSDPNFKFEIVSPTTHGTLTRSAAASWVYDYVPETDYTGDDSFTFRAFDGQAYSDIATLTIKNVGSLPVARNDEFKATLASSASIPAPGVLSNDTQSNSSTPSAALNVSSGSVTLNADGSFTWTAPASGPTSGFVYFQYRLSDPYYQGTPPLATVTLQLIPLVAQSQSGSILEDTQARIHLNASGATPPTLAITKNPAHGTLSGTVPDVTYTPARDWNGTDSFEFSASDGTHTATGTITIIVDPFNDAPTASDSTFATDEDTPLTLTLPASDVEGDALTFEIVQGPSVGTLVAGTTPGTYTFTPPTNFSGPVFFNWRTKDATLYSRVATGKINVAPVNDAPVAQSQTVETNEDKDAPIQLGATDVDNGFNQLTYKVIKAPTHGELYGTAPYLYYHPDANWSGTDSLEFAVYDGSLYSVPATITITVKPVNDAPIAQRQTVTGDEDTNIDITLAGSDVEGDALTFQISRQPQHGTLKQDGSAVVYRAFDDWYGTDSFGFTANDGQLTSAEANVTVIVRPVSDTPVAHADAYTTDEDKALSIAAPGVLANDSDVDGETLNAVLKSQPANGSVALKIDGSFTYTPDRDWSGTDSFTYDAFDGTLESTPVTIAVAPVNDAPVARPDELNGKEDEALSISSSALLANDFDAEGDALSITAVTNPAHGTLVAQEGGYLYTPTANWNGDDEFSYTISDGQESATSKVTLHIKAVNDAPFADAQTLETNEDTAKDVALSGTDLDGDALTFKVTRQPAHGVLSGTAPNLTYTPNANFNGSDSFEFVANDGTVDSAPVAITLTVNAVNDAPVALAQGIALEEDSSKTFTLGGSDIEGDDLTFKITRTPEHGILTGTAPALTFTPDANWNGTTTFEFTVSDGKLESVPATVELRVNAVNDAPIAAAQTATTSEDSPQVLTLAGSDLDGDALTFKITRQPSHGAVALNGNSATYTPAPDFNGDDSFAFVANDGTVDSAAATVTLTVTPVNDAPAATSQNQSLDEDASKTIVLGGSDVDGDALTFAVTAAPTNGTLSGTAPNLTYTPKANFNGSDSFTFSVTDPSGSKGNGSVSLTVRPVNDAPTATPLSIATTVALAKSFSVSANAADLDGDALTFALKTAPTNGTVTSQGGANFTYTPRLAFVGTDSFAISATDPSGASATIVVSVTVSALPTVNRAPVTQGSNFVVLEDGTLTFNLVASDPDGDALTYIILQNPQSGTLTAKGGASFTFTPTANYFGTQTFTYQVRDARGATSNISTVQLQTNAVNDAPSYDLSSTAITVAKNSNVFQQSSFARNLNVGGGTYEQGQVINFTLQTSDTSLFDQQPGISSNGTLTFRPRNGKTGTATITVNARDNGGTSDGGKDSAPVRTFTITIR